MKILLIEDDPRIAHFLVRGLKEEGHLMTWETDGLAGYQAAQKFDFDVIILDLMLPNMDGREICQNLRAKGVATKILMLTALETTADLVTGLGLGADDYLTKPFAFEELSARLSVLGRRTPAIPPDAVLRSGGLRFDPATLVATIHGVRLNMTSLEYALLEFLLQEKDKVVSRSRILQNVWGVTEDPLTNVVDVYIRRLRAHLAPFDAAKMVVTIRGRGYCLRDMNSAHDR